jgi:hypothetical protein
MNVNISNILYIAFRLAPFIIVCFFTLESFLNWNIKGIVYLCGLLVACVVTVLASNIGGGNSTESVIDNNICNSISLGQGGSLLSKLPLSTAVFSYTFFYLFTFIFNLARQSSYSSKKPIGKNNDFNKKGVLQNILVQNLPTLILFPLLLVIDAAWNMMNGCSPWYNILVSTVISGAIGVAWASVIASTGNPGLMYLSSSMGDVCSKPTETMFRCRTRNASADSKNAAIPTELKPATVVTAESFTSTIEHIATIVPNAALSKNERLQQQTNASLNASLNAFNTKVNTISQQISSRPLVPAPIYAPVQAPVTAPVPVSTQRLQSKPATSKPAPRKPAPIFSKKSKKR